MRLRTLSQMMDAPRVKWWRHAGGLLVLLLLDQGETVNLMSGKHYSRKRFAKGDKTHT